MSEKDYLQDISEIKNMMSKSSQFISLSGLSGILAGIYALIGTVYAAYLLQGTDPYSSVTPSDLVPQLTLTAAVILVLAIGTAVLLTYFKAKKTGDIFWNATSRRLLLNFMIPLLSGGIFMLLLLKNHYYELLAPVTLLFYGLACVNAAKYTFRDIHYLGISMTVIGLVATAFPGFALFFWALGFGVCHIVYGSIMHYKYDRNPS